MSLLPAAVQAPCDWSAYAEQYDLLMAHHPPYQELVSVCLEEVLSWQLPAGSRVADLGGGTGNFSVRLALARPEWQVLHVDGDAAMLARAQAKASAAGIRNWRPARLDLDSVSWPLAEVDGAVAIHVLYACAEPGLVLRRIASALRPGARLLACDLGRPLRVWRWAAYLAWSALRRDGLAPTLRLLCATGLARRANLAIAGAQRAGRCWMHDLEGFRAAVEEAGLQVLSARDDLYRGDDDVVVACRPWEER